MMCLEGGLNARSLRHGRTAVNPGHAVIILGVNKIPQLGRRNQEFQIRIGGRAKRTGTA